MIIQADARYIPVADQSIDLVVTSPPYFALRSYTDGGRHYDGQIGAETTPHEYIDSLIACTREWMRALKPAGSIWVNLGDKYSGSPSGPQGATSGFNERTGQRFAQRRKVSHKIPSKSLMGLPWRYALRCIDELGLILRAEVIWDKPNGLPESVTDRVRRSHEQWFHFVQNPKYFSAVDEIRHECAPASMERRHHGLVAGSSNMFGSLPGSVWEIPTEPLKVPEELGVDHFAAFPTEWPRRIIAGWSPVGGIVLDPFGGTGTTALVAHVCGRQGVSLDRSADYCAIARWRSNDPGEIAKAMKVPKPAKQAEGQLDLFGALRR